MTFGRPSGDLREQKDTNWGEMVIHGGGEIEGKNTGERGGGEEKKHNSALFFVYVGKKQ